MGTGASSSSTTREPPPFLRIAAPPNLDIRTHGTKHVAYLVQDLDTLMADLKTKDVDIAMDVFPMQGDKVGLHP